MTQAEGDQIARLLHNAIQKKTRKGYRSGQRWILEVNKERNEEAEPIRFPLTEGDLIVYRPRAGLRGIYSTKGRLTRQFANT